MQPVSMLTVVSRENQRVLKVQQALSKKTRLLQGSMRTFIPTELVKCWFLSTTPGGVVVGLAIGLKRQLKINPHFQYNKAASYGCTSLHMWSR